MFVPVDQKQTLLHPKLFLSSSGPRARALPLRLVATARFAIFAMLKQEHSIQFRMPRDTTHAFLQRRICQCASRRHRGFGRSDYRRSGPQLLQFNDVFLLLIACAALRSQGTPVYFIIITNGNKGCGAQFCENYSTDQISSCTSATRTAECVIRAYVFN